MTAAVGPVGAGFDSVGVVVPTATFVVPDGVTADGYDGLFILAWTAAVNSETPPTITPLGTGWSVVLGPVTSGLSVGWAAYQKAGGLKAGDVVAFQIGGGGRATMGTDLYVARADPGVGGAITSRTGTSAVTTAASLNTAEPNELVLAVSVERTAGAGTLLNSVAGGTLVNYRESATNGNLSIAVATVPSASTAGPTGAVTFTYSVTSSSGGAGQIRIPSETVVTPPAGLLVPTTELVAVAWLKAAVPYLGNRVATELPMDNTSWSASGFTTISVSGGDPHMYLPLARPVLTANCWAVRPNGGRPPWNQAAQQAEQIRNAALAHGTIPRSVSLPSGYAPARVLSVIPVSEPQRTPGDAASYARIGIDLEFWWSR